MLITLRFIRTSQAEGYAKKIMMIRFHMLEKNKNILKSLTTIPAILMGYVFISVCQYLYSLIYASENFSIITIRTIVLLSSLALSYLTFKRNIIACWVMTIFLILSGISIFSFGIFAFPASQYLLKIMNIIIGIYFSFGAVVLFTAIRKGEMKDIDSLMRKA